MPTDIPLIDFSPLLADDLASKARVAAEVYRACHQVGFLYLTNHGIPQACIDAALAQLRQFFALE